MSHQVNQQLDEVIVRGFQTEMLQMMVWLRKIVQVSQLCSLAEEDLSVQLSYQLQPRWKLRKVSRRRRQIPQKAEVIQTKFLSGQANVWFVCM